MKTISYYYKANFRPENFAGDLEENIILHLKFLSDGKSLLYLTVWSVGWSVGRSVGRSKNLTYLTKPLLYIVCLISFSARIAI